MYFSRNIWRKGLLIFTVFIMVSIFASYTDIVSAHSPSSMSLSYSSTTKRLDVAITHQVTNPNTHYVNTIIVKINDEIERDDEYSSQPDSTFTYTYEDIETYEGDMIEVTATCNQGGLITEQVTVTADDVSKTKNDGSTSGFALLIFVLALVLILIIVRRRGMLFM